MARKSRILFLQFANPAGYPPLEHASRILAGQGLGGAVPRGGVGKERQR